MKYVVEVKINKPLQEVWNAFNNPQNMLKWYPGLISFETISGIQGQVDAVSKLKFDKRNRNMEMTETITERKEGEYMSGIYETKGIKNPNKNWFTSNGDVTVWKSENEFLFSKQYRLLGLMKRMFIKKTTEDMNLFKKAVEEGEVS